MQTGVYSCHQMTINYFANMMVLYDRPTHMSTLMKEKKGLLTADLQPGGRTSAACCCRTSGPAGAKEDKSLQRSHGDAE